MNPWEKITGDLVWCHILKLTNEITFFCAGTNHSWTEKEIAARCARCSDFALEASCVVSLANKCSRWLLENTQKYQNSVALSVSIRKKVKISLWNISLVVYQIWRSKIASLTKKTKRSCLTKPYGFTKAFEAKPHRKHNLFTFLLTVRKNRTPKKLIKKKPLLSPKQPITMPSPDSRLKPTS